MTEPEAARVVLLATPEFGVPTLRTLVRRGYNVVGVVCQPDRAAGRGLHLSPRAVKQAALALGLAVFQWSNLREPEALATLEGLKADLFLVAAYGLYIPAEIVALPPKGFLNLHPSLLPRHRGASPVAAAILAGDLETGVTVLCVASEMDAGDILAQARTPIGPDETTGALTVRLGEWGADVYMDAVARWLRGEGRPRAQEASQATWSQRLTREDGNLDWRKDPVLLARQVRAFDPWPGTHTSWRGEAINILAASALPEWRGQACPGTVLRIPQGIAVVASAGALLLKTLQVAGKRAMAAPDFANGARGFVGAVLGQGEEVGHNGAR
jgi:methionyl-tRNA formyltransferase